MYPLLILGVLVCLSACGDKGAGDSAGSATDTSRSGPADTDTDIGWLTVSAGLYYTCGLTTSGSVECWGSDGDGQTSPPEL